MEYKVVTEDSPNEVWATGFYGDYGKAKAEKRIAEGYFHKHMYESDKSKKLIVVMAKMPHNIPLVHKTRTYPPK